MPQDLHLEVFRSPCGDTYVYNIPFIKSVLPVLYYIKDLWFGGLLF